MLFIKLIEDKIVRHLYTILANHNSKLLNLSSFNASLFHSPLRWIQKCISMLKNSEVDRVILTVNAEKNYNVNETIEFVKELRKFCQ